MSQHKPPRRDKPPDRGRPKDDRPRFVVHLALTATDLPAAQQFARVMARSLAFLPQLDARDTTVSEADNQDVRHRVFCDQLLDGGRRCLLRADHPGACARRLNR